jgi:hypothetical protein
MRVAIGKGKEHQKRVDFDKNVSAADFSLDVTYECQRSIDRPTRATSGYGLESRRTALLMRLFSLEQRAWPKRATTR